MAASTSSDPKKSRGSESSSATAGIDKEPEANADRSASNRSKEWLISIMDADDWQDAGSNPRIQKVPARIRENEKNKKYFDPQVVSLGPYHHGEPHFKPMEKHKITAARQFVMSNKSKGVQEITQVTESFYNEVMGVIEEARTYYATEVVDKLSDEAFACMMFLDGCFVLYFIENMNKPGDIDLDISTGDIPLIVRDMFLLENQLPFVVLNKLMRLKFGSGDEGKKVILKFINLEILIPMGFIHSDWLDSPPVEFIRSGDDAPLHLLDILWTMMMGFNPTEMEKRFKDMEHNFGSIAELKEAGIRFGKSQKGYLTDIRFEENFFFPRLLLPPMVINDATISKLLNLTAFEICSQIHNGCGVTSYICFMDSLINHGADVKELRSKGILHHSLGNDEDVARLFNDWPAKAMKDLDVYEVVKKRIRLHQRTNGKVSTARWLDTYFRGPWTTVLSITGALFLIFSFMQTLFTVFPLR